VYRKGNKTNLQENESTPASFQYSIRAQAHSLSMKDLTVGIIARLKIAQ